MSEIRRGVFDPHGKPLTLGDLRTLIHSANKLRYPDAARIEFETPLAGDRRAVKIAVIEDADARSGDGTAAV